MFDRLSIDPGHRTLGELIQERQWAVEEISRLHKEVTRLNARRDGASKRPNVNQDTLPAGPDDSFAGRRLLRLAGLQTLGRFSRAKGSFRIASITDARRCGGARQTSLPG